MVTDERYYLDTSAFVKRYVEEPGSARVDKLFSGAYSGRTELCLSQWNILEALVVFDKYSRRLGVNAKEISRVMLREVKTLLRLRSMRLTGVTPSVIKRSMRLVLSHHIYSADAIQIVTAQICGASFFVTADKRLGEVAEEEGLSAILVGVGEAQ